MITSLIRIIHITFIDTHIYIVVFMYPTFLGIAMFQYPCLYPYSMSVSILCSCEAASIVAVLVFWSSLSTDRVFCRYHCRFMMSCLQLVACSKLCHLVQLKVGKGICCLHVTIYLVRFSLDISIYCDFISDCKVSSMGLIQKNQF